MTRASRTWTKRASAVAAAAAAVLGPVAVAAPALAAPAQPAHVAATSPAGTYLVRYSNAAMAKDAVLAAKGSVTRSLSALSTLVVTLPRGGADALAGNPVVLAVTRD